jgi:hypothetical protein
VESVGAAGSLLAMSPSMPDCANSLFVCIDTVYTEHKGVGKSKSKAERWQKIDSSLNLS